MLWTLLWLLYIQVTITIQISLVIVMNNILTELRNIVNHMCCQIV